MAIISIFFIACGMVVVYCGGFICAVRFIDKYLFANSV